MDSIKSSDLKKIREAIRQAEANIKFEEVESEEKQQEKNSNPKTLRRGAIYDKRPLG